MEYAKTAMNIIHSTFNDHLPSYTAVGGSGRGASTGLSAVILGRSGRQSRFAFFEELSKSGFDYVLSMERSDSRYDLESLTSAFPFVRFILLKDEVSPGEEINLAASELSSPLFFVMRNDTKILRGSNAERTAERLLSGSASGSSGSAAGGSVAGAYKRLCTVPVIQDGHAEIMPTLIAPALLPGSLIRTIPHISEREGQSTLYPFDGIGVYDRERFIRLGGFDSSIKSFYWQLMDFGFRASLWGEEIAFTQFIKLSYEDELPVEDSTVTESCMRFILKNLSPVFRRDYAYIPFRRFPSWLGKRKKLSSAWKEFREIRQWVKINRYRFKSDARTIAERFETGDENNSGEEK